MEMECVEALGHLTESELENRAQEIRARVRKRKAVAAKRELPRLEAARRDRWVNWDQMAVGEDFWDLVDEVDAERCGAIREQRQMEDIRRVHERRLAHVKIDMDAFMRDEPFAEMCRKPREPRDPKPSSSKSRIKHHSRSVLDRIEEVVAEIEGGAQMRDVAARCEISRYTLYSLLRMSGHGDLIGRRGGQKKLEAM